MASVPTLPKSRDTVKSEDGGVKVGRVELAKVFADAGETERKEQTKKAEALKVEHDRLAETLKDQEECDRRERLRDKTDARLNEQEKQDNARLTRKPDLQPTVESDSTSSGEEETHETSRRPRGYDDRQRTAA